MTEVAKQLKQQLLNLDLDLQLKIIGSIDNRAFSAIIFKIQD